MLRRWWKPVAATTLLIGAPSYLYHRHRLNAKIRQETVEIPVRTPGKDGKPAMTTRSFPLLSQSAVDQRLTEHAQAESLQRAGMHWRFSTASVAANEPTEDAHAQAVVARDLDDPLAPGDWLFFAVMDGHGGPHTSRLLSKTLINAVMLELSSLIHTRKRFGWFSAPSVQSPQSISLAVQRAFTKFDQELVSAPLKILGANLDKEAVKLKQVPDLSQHPLALPSMHPAVSGSCALMAVFDTAQRDLYVACTGDSRAVAGIWVEDENGNGSWKVEALSQDQTGRNPDELKRMQSEHPPDEAESVIMRGRVLGGLEPTRAFGDARYKWPHQIQEVLNSAFLVGNNQPLRPPPSTFKTPPYVTATPVVVHRKFSFDSADGRNSPSPSSPRFVVLATDGLWDRLSSEEVVALVGGALTGVRGEVPKADLSTRVPTSSGSASTVEGKDKRSSKDAAEKQKGTWAFSDDNLSVHLIRNAFGGRDTEAVRTLMSIPSPHARRFRDDTTVTVVVWDEHTKGADEGVANGSSHAEAKL